MRTAPTPSTMRRFATSAPTGHGIVIPAFHPAARAGRTIFPSRVFDPTEVGRVLKDGHQSRKIGKTITKGKQRGWPIYTLTLEERESCTRSCSEWVSCYGNNMHAAERIVHGPELIMSLSAEVARLAIRHRAGFMIRLHVLGDFWSVEYVEFWADQLRRYPNLQIFGFTARTPESAIGRAIDLMIAEAGWKRAAIRFSGAAGSHRAARVIGPGEADSDAIVCPAQTGATSCCATCALCWNSTRSIAFRRH